VGSEECVEPPVRRAFEVLLRHRERILVERYDTDLEIETSGSYQPDHALDRGLDLAALDARDGRLRHPGALCELPLGQPGAPSRLSNEMAAVHHAL
jgi:hypothetical protein